MGLVAAEVQVEEEDPEEVVLLLVVVEDREVEGEQWMMAWVVVEGERRTVFRRTPALGAPGAVRMLGGLVRQSRGSGGMGLLVVGREAQMGVVEGE